MTALAGSYISHWNRKVIPDARFYPRVKTQRAVLHCPVGEYKVNARVSDLNADISFEVELNFYLR